MCQVSMSHALRHIWIALSILYRNACVHIFGKAIRCGRSHFVLKVGRFGVNVLGVALRQEIIMDFVRHLGATTLCAYDHQSSATLVARLVGSKTEE